MPSFTPKQACFALDVPRGTLNWWAHRGFMTGLGAEAFAAGKRREISLIAIAVLAVMKRFAAAGVSIEDASEWAKIAVLYFDGNPSFDEFNVYFTEPGSFVVFPEIHGQAIPEKPRLRITVFLKAILSEIKARLESFEETSRADNKAKRVRARRQ